MRNQIFLLTVLAVICWTGRGDQPSNDFYLDDDEDTDGGSGNFNDVNEDSSWVSSFSSYTDVNFSEDSSGDLLETEVVGGSIHLNMVFIEDYYNNESFEYVKLEKLFIQVIGETMMSSPLQRNYVETVVLRFRPGSVAVDFEVEIFTLVDNGQPVAEESITEILRYGIEEGKLDELHPNISSLVIKSESYHSDPKLSRTPTMQTSGIIKLSRTPMMQTSSVIETFTPSTASSNISPGGDLVEDNNEMPYKPSGGDDPNYRANNPDVEKTENIFDMILGDPIIIAAIVGGLIVILLSVILLFLFVVYRLKKKDEGSYSLDEPAKSKDPTAYWKETKEFYA